MDNFKLKAIALKQKNLEDPDFFQIIEYKDLKKGMGVTIGNTLRRILLSYIPGYAIKNVTVSGIQHEFSSISGVKEDTALIISNLKKVILKSDVKKSSLILNLQGPCVVTAKDLKSSNFIIVNPDAYICTIDKGFHLSLEAFVEKGVGITLASELNDHSVEVGSIVCDSFFSPVENVNFEVVNTPQGSENLYLSILTNGSISPLEAFNLACEILDEQISKTAVLKRQVAVAETVVNRELHSPSLYLQIEDLPDLSTRMIKCLKMLGVIYVGDLVKLSKETLMNEPNFGENSLNKLISKLNSLGLDLGMQLDNWPPANLSQKAKEIMNNSVL